MSRTRKSTSRNVNDIFQMKNIQVEQLQNRVKKLEAELAQTKSANKKTESGRIRAMKLELEQARHSANIKLKKEIQQRKEAVDKLHEVLIELSVLDFYELENAYFLQRMGTPIYQDIGVFSTPKQVRTHIKARVINDDKWCRYCMNSPATTVDHIWPESFGGPSVLNNLVGACNECNHYKNNLLPHQWKEFNIRINLPTRLYSVYLNT